MQLQIIKMPLNVGKEIYSYILLIIGLTLSREMETMWHQTKYYRLAENLLSTTSFFLEYNFYTIQ